MWTLMKLAHDWALLADVAEDFTLVIGVLSWAFQLLASFAALYWAAAVTDVFVSRVPEGNGACYYQLQPFATLTALGAALLLLYFSHVKMNNLVLSLVNYYCNIFNMPYGAVKGIAASQPLLTKGLHGDSDVLPSPYQQLEFRNRKRLCIFARSIFFWFWLLLFGLTLPFDFFGNLFLRVTELAVSQAWSLAPVVFLKLATLLAAAATPVIGGALAASMLVTVIKEALEDWRSLRAIDKLTVSAQLLLSTALLLLALSTSGGAWNITQAVVFHRGADGLQQHWEWYHHGKAIMYYVFSCIRYGSRWVWPLKWRHDRQQWWAWCLYSSKAKCNNLESIIPHVPHVWLSYGPDALRVWKTACLRKKSFWSKPGVWVSLGCRDATVVLTTD